MEDGRVEDLLKRALEAVEGAGVPDDLREVAFTTALSLLAGGQPTAPVGPPPPLGGSNAPPPPTASGSTGSTMLDTVAAGLGVSPEKIQRLFAEKNGAPELILKASKLPKAKAAASYDIALLVMAARQLGDLDEYTDAKVIREAVKRYGKFDQSNFAQHMRSLDNLILTDGKGVSAKRKLTHPGVEAAGELATKYLDES